MASLNYSSVEIRVGFFVAFCVALFVAMLVTYGKVAPVWRGRQEINVAFTNVTMLRPDAPVRYNGVEVGRVKWVKLLHLDRKTLDERFPSLTRRDLDNLPLRPAALRELREASDDDFDTLCRKALTDSTMIELCLEVLQEGDVKRYRLDDQIRIVSTVFGDAAIEIISGSGTVNTSTSPRLMIGMSGDFFSNLAKSMGDVKEILSNVTEVVGTDERRSFERATARFSQIDARLDKMAQFSEKRAEVTARRIDVLGDDITKTLNKASDEMEKIDPQARKTFESIKNSFAQYQDRLSEVEKEASAAMKEVSAEVKVLRADISFTLDQSKPNLEQMKTNIHEVYEGLGNLSERMDGMRDTAGRALVQSEPDVARATFSLANGLTNLRHAAQAGNENKDLMISNRDLGEYEYATALEIYRSMTRATRKIRNAGADLNDVIRMAAALPVDAPESPAAGLKGVVAPILSKGAMAEHNLAAMRKPLDEARDAIETKMIPEFERKKSAWLDDAPLK